ncbi:N-acyl-D-glucosamine 2-epimerase [Paenibacillus beijingensis]|uniref:N-acyl-D-glucosamine 2-epimerase n=1 Tax=Paenibacillus beijingensis TaxID=1126833 RepID=A0A0D5NH71_9BACL|nr:N-acyl-D-glucosamine 2-epimerase [Paenibacillus beijingensis]AJY74312.1 N-acyl-D-glucosamine 2-epimerase [Paenibacillus beijingensis]
MTFSPNQALYGPSIQIDPLFPYYQQRSEDSIAEEIEWAGYRNVHYFVVNENVVNRSLIDAFHKRGMSVWAMVIGNGTFSTERFPDEWPSWQMELLKETSDGFWRLSPFSSEYVQWKKSAMAKLVAEYPFDGIEIAEPYFPEWGGIERGVYGDIGPLARREFRERFGLEMPDFRNPDFPDYYKKNPDTYEAWIRFRVDAVNGFINEMINGIGGVRETRPDILVATWSLAVDAGPDSVKLLKEDQGLDAPSMIAKVRPNIHYLQTHWPDWGRGDLPADYVKNYRPFIDQIRSQFPEIPLAVQADIGSSKTMIKSGDWLNRFIAAAEDLGFASWTAYEYHIGGYMYDTRPEPVNWSRKGKHNIVISFNKRVDVNSAANSANYTILENGRERIADWKSITVDGNRIFLESEQLPEGTFEIEIRHILDTPDRWLYKDRRANSVLEGTMMSFSGITNSFIEK